MIASLTAVVRHACAGALDFALPRVCVICDDLLNASHGMICATCAGAIPLLPKPRCERCGHPTYGAACQWCALLLPAVTAARSVCWVPDGAGGALVHKLKYGGWTGVGSEMARVMVHVTDLPRTSDSVLVPVPLGVARRRERGFNQCESIASAIGDRWNLRVIATALVRTRETASQVLLTPDERSANVHCAFAAGPAANDVRGRHVILVDDVITTAATLNACAAAALSAGAHATSYLTFGRARAAFDKRAHPRSETRWQFGSASTDSVGSAARSSAPRKSAG